MMNDSHLLNAISASIYQATGQAFVIKNVVSVSGGCINSSYIVNDEKQHFFIKSNRAQALAMFDAELLALNEIAKTQTIRVPLPVCTGQHGEHSWLVMQNLHLQGQGDHQQLGEQIAAMHGITKQQFGWHTDNTIGSTPQINTICDSWVEFFHHHRLAFQLSLAEKNGYRGKLQETGNALLECLPEFFVDYRPPASLLHGDLWSGNYAFLDNSQPAIFDPALYYGDREADIAMTELFGGFTKEFRASYIACSPLDSGYASRKYLYNSYHLLNHLNLFGGGYAAQAENTMNKVLSERNG